MRVLKTYGPLVLKNGQRAGAFLALTDFDYLT